MIINISLQIDDATIQGQISIEEFLNSNRDVIVEAAAKELSEKLCRTKKMKEAVANVIERENGDETD